MSATINGKTVATKTLDELRDIARRESSEAWIYGNNDQGAFGFCNDPDCNCDQFTRYD